MTFVYSLKVIWSDFFLFDSKVFSSTATLLDWVSLFTYMTFMPHPYPSVHIPITSSRLRPTTMVDGWNISWPPLGCKGDTGVGFDAQQSRSFFVRTGTRISHVVAFNQRTLRPFRLFTSIVTWRSMKVDIRFRTGSCAEPRWVTVVNATDFQVWRKATTNLSRVARDIRNQILAPGLIVGFMDIFFEMSLQVSSVEPPTWKYQICYCGLPNNIR